MVPNAHPLRGLRKDGLLAVLEATSDGTDWTVDSTQTDLPFFSTTVTQLAGGAVFSFQPLGANKKCSCMVSLEEPADDPANTVGHYIFARALNPGAGTVRVLTATFAADPVLTEPSNGARLRLWIYAETL